MVTVNIHEAKTQLSKLVDQAVKGEAFIIAKAGKPLVKVAALDAPPAPQRLGFLAGEIAVPPRFRPHGRSRDCGPVREPAQKGAILTLEIVPWQA
jgi:prevent-host-death family protein